MHRTGRRSGDLVFSTLRVSAALLGLSLAGCLVHDTKPQEDAPAISVAEPPRPTPPEVAAPETVVMIPAPSDDPPPRTLKEQRVSLFRTMERELDLSANELDAVKAIFEGSPFLGQGNPAISQHPMERAECRSIRDAAGLVSEAHPPCARTNMVPLYDPAAGETANDATICIDQFEFPNVACEYPVVNVSAREAAMLCEAEGKRLCDAHEWEGACAGALHAADAEYAFGSPRQTATAMHNRDREKRWAYGPAKDHTLCATGSKKSPSCPGGGWKECGSNTYPAGAFPACVSPFGVYDQHGNAAEHMSLPLDPSELGSRAGHGATEMKGSWFAFQRHDAHEDDCRWRAKDWHASKVMSEASHSNYHLGFRCCSDVRREVSSVSKPATRG
jgi:formylglycine-generating enzyme